MILRTGESSHPANPVHLDEHSRDREHSLAAPGCVHIDLCMRPDAAGLLPASVWDVFQPCQQSSSSASQKGRHGSLLMFAALLGWFGRLTCRTQPLGAHMFYFCTRGWQEPRLITLRRKSTISRWIEGSEPIGLGPLNRKRLEPCRLRRLDVLFQKKKRPSCSLPS